MPRAALRREEHRAAGARARAARFRCPRAAAARATQRAAVRSVPLDRPGLAEAGLAILARWAKARPVLASLSRRALVVGALSCSTFGCSSGTSDSTALPHPTVVEVSPLEFAAPPACDAGAGSLLRYIATLTDVTPVSATDASPANFTLPSSALQVETAGVIHYEPIPCRLSVDFGWVVPGHRYHTELLGYDRSDLELLQAGLPVAIDAATREVVEPRWRATCGDDASDGDAGGAGNDSDHNVLAESELTRTVRFCGPWIEAQP